MIHLKQTISGRFFSARGIMALLFVSLICFLSACTVGTISEKKQNTKLKLDDGKGAYATNKYRNLFKENGHLDAEITKKLEDDFQQIFHGDSATQTILFPAGKNENGKLAYICDVWHKDIRSEGMSYGMMVSVQMNKKADFDAIWNYAYSKMYVSDPNHPSEGYFAWSLKRDGTPNSETPAPDGEEYFVMALYFASGRWGNGAGIYNYRAWADKILTTMRNHPLKTGPTKFGPRTVGKIVHPEKKMILFVPEGHQNYFSDPSYHLPAFYELWARWAPTPERAFWAAAADSSRQYFQKTTHPQTGLAPEYADFDGKPIKSPFNQNAHRFAYDSWRTAMNWSVDWAWWHKDPREQALSNRIQTFFASQGIHTYSSIYELDGKPVNNSHSTGLVATNATVSLAATHPVAKEFVEALWNQPAPQQLGDRYYAGLLHLMSLLHCSGNFKIYQPK